MTFVKLRRDCDICRRHGKYYPNRAQYFIDEKAACAPHIGQLIDEKAQYPNGVLVMPSDRKKTGAKP